MDSTPASRSTPSRWLNYAALAGATIGLWLILSDWPDPATDYLDASWQVILVQAYEMGRSFGNGIIFSAGPLGFLNSHFFLPDSLGLKLAWEIGGRLILTALFVALTAGLPAWRRIVFLVLAALLLALFPDTFFTLLLVLAVVRWILPRDATLGRLAIALCVAAFLSQLKFTHCLLAVFGVGMATADRILQRQWRRALLVGAGFVGLFLALWLAAGQNPVRLPDYFRYSWQFSSGYSWAMSFDETWPVFLFGAAVAVLGGACLWQIWRGASGSRLAAAGLPVFLAGALFITWKHGFTRADGHVLGFFTYAILMGVAFPAIVPASSRRWWFDTVAPLSFVGLWLSDPGLIQQTPRSTLIRLQMGYDGLTHVERVKANFATNLAAQRVQHDMPALRQTIGKSTVDLLNYEQGLLLLNGLNYHPRPIPQSYASYTGPLLQKNAGFFRRTTAPDFVVVRVGSIDGRYPTQDDSLVMAELPMRYDLKLVDGDNVVLAKKAVQPSGEPRRTTMLERDIRFGDEITLPDAGDRALWLQVRFQLSWLGRVRALLYKPPVLMMAATDSRGHTERFRIVPTIASTGFLIQPMIQNSAEYAHFVRGNSSRLVQKIKFEPAIPSELEFWGNGSLVISKLPDLPAGPIDPLRAVVDSGVSNVVPTELKSDTTVQYVPLSNRQRVLLVHANGEIAFPVGPGVRRVKLEFGIAEGAYMNGGKTDGADFAVECEKADGTKSIIWRRRLEPATNPADRGTLAHTVEFPPGTVSVRLLTLRGAGNEGGWDWTYWSQTLFAP